MKEIILLKMGETVLKGLNKNTFEDILMKNCRYRLSKIGNFNLRKAQSTIYVEPSDENANIDEAFELMRCVFGIVALSRSIAVEKNIEAICKAPSYCLRGKLESAKSFKVAAKRSDKKFAYNSPEICREVGGAILKACPHLTVDVHNPEITVTIEIREKAAYISGEKISGAGGLPIGTGGVGLLMLSGGIDSPVAGYMMAKRGVEILAVHFESPPYTSERALLKVEKLASKMARYCGRIKLIIVPFTQIQEEIRDKCPEEFFTLIMRRIMVKIANITAKQNNAFSIITGESLGQVASQTMQAIVCTDAAAELPIFRPLIGMDKEEIVQISRKINTFETSILPYEDCCTVFTPKHPLTKPDIKSVEQAENLLDTDKMITHALERIKCKKITFEEV